MKTPFIRIDEQTPAITQEIIFNPSTPEQAELADQGQAIAKEFFEFASKQINCSGLAANQVCCGDEERIPFRMLMFKNHGIPILAINPEIIQRSGRKEIQAEGCLSWPRKSIVAIRYEGIIVKYTNREGTRLRKNLTGKEAQIFQHEFDHLEGIKERVVDEKSDIAAVIDEARKEMLGT